MCVQRVLSYFGLTEDDVPVVYVIRMSDDSGTKKFSMDSDEVKYCTGDCFDVLHSFNFCPDFGGDIDSFYQ